VLAPNPVRSGEPVTLYFSSPPSQALWQVYDLSGQRVAGLDSVGNGPYQLSTQGLAPGIYFVQVAVDYASGVSQVDLFKFAVIR
jgi:hypothetical protein